MTSSDGTASTTELSSIATIESTTVRPEMIAIGTPYCTERLMVPTSRVTRVTRSPLLALSTRPSGRARIVRTMYSRADDSRSWPKTVEVRWARNVSSAWAQTTPTTSRARVLRDDAASPATVRLIRSPSRRGHDEAGRGGEAVEHDQRDEHPRGARAAGCGRTPARPGCRPPASPARACATGRSSPAPGARAGRGGGAGRVTRSVNDPPPAGSARAG